MTRTNSCGGSPHPSGHALLRTSRLAAQPMPPSAAGIARSLGKGQLSSGLRSDIVTIALIPAGASARSRPPALRSPPYEQDGYLRSCSKPDRDACAMQGNWIEARFQL